MGPFALLALAGTAVLVESARTGVTPLTVVRFWFARSTGKPVDGLLGKVPDGGDIEGISGGGGGDPVSML